MKEVLVLQWLTHTKLIDNSKYNLQFYQGHVFDITIYFNSDGQAYVNDVLEIVLVKDSRSARSRIFAS